MAAFRECQNLKRAAGWERNSVEKIVRAHAFEEALRKDRGWSAEKGTTKKGKRKEESEQRHKEKRSPLPPCRVMFTRSPRTCTLLCGQILDEEGVVFAEGRGNHNRTLVQ